MTLLGEIRYGVPRRIRRYKALARISIKRVSPKVAKADTMLGPGGYEHYFTVGLSAMDNTRAARLAAGATGDPARILDLPCGHGRVLRWMRAEWANAHIVAADIDRDAVRFCADTFDAEGIPTTNPLNAVDVGREFDLIFCGSLLTHFAEDRWPEVLQYFGDRLAPRGVAVVTTAGDLSAAFMKGDRQAVAAISPVPPRYGNTAVDAATALDSYCRTGFGYCEYPGGLTPGYGTSLSSPEWVRRQLDAAGFDEVFFAPHGWNHHQDVWGITISAPRPASQA